MKPQNLTHKFILVFQHVPHEHPGMISDVVKAKEILEILYGKPKKSIKKGWRSRSGRDNP